MCESERQREQENESDRKQRRSVRVNLGRQPKAKRPDVMNRENGASRAFTRHTHPPTHPPTRTQREREQESGMEAWSIERQVYKSMHREEGRERERKKERVEKNKTLFPLNASLFILLSHQIIWLKQEHVGNADLCGSLEEHGDVVPGKEGARGGIPARVNLDHGVYLRDQATQDHARADAVEEFFLVDDCESEELRVCV